jgi:proteasome lid subunit RPN8/RPN11
MSRRPDAAGLSLPAELASRLLEHARRGLPNEACALLGGNADQGRVTTVHLARNRLASPYRYDVHPADVARIVHAIEAAGEDLVGIFHSHPTSPPVPSPTDRREARYAAIHLIAGISGGQRLLEAWRIERQRMFRLPLAIGDPVALGGSAVRPGRD